MGGGGRDRTLGSIWRDQTHPDSILPVLEVGHSTLLSHLLGFLWRADEEEDEGVSHRIDATETGGDEKSGTNLLGEHQRLDLDLLLLPGSGDLDGMLDVVGNDAARPLLVDSAQVVVRLRWEERFVPPLDFGRSITLYGPKRGGTNGEVRLVRRKVVSEKRRWRKALTYPDDSIQSVELAIQSGLPRTLSDTCPESFHVGLRGRRKGGQLRDPSSSRDDTRKESLTSARICSAIATYFPFCTEASFLVDLPLGAGP
jgi:hypothetical protein